jgi:hypothetical protein
MNSILKLMARLVGVSIVALGLVGCQPVVEMGDITVDCPHEYISEITVDCPHKDHLETECPFHHEKVQTDCPGANVCVGNLNESLTRIIQEVADRCEINNCSQNPQHDYIITQGIHSPAAFDSWAIRNGNVHNINDVPEDMPLLSISASHFSKSYILCLNDYDLEKAETAAMAKLEEIHPR